MADAAPHPAPLPASGASGARETPPRPAGAGRGRGPRKREGEGQPPATAGTIVLRLPKIVVTALLVLAIADMLAGVFLRYVMVEITDFFDLDPVNFFWVEEVGELSLTWLTMIGAAIGIADRIHFTLHVLTHHLPVPVRRVIYVINHLLIAGFGGLAAWFGTRLAINNSVLTSPALQINLGWVYAAVSVGGALIAIYGLALALAGPNAADAEEDAVAIAAGD
jgi:TRAP-type C4-dicarboxylate transport system permease small subunit